MSIASPVCFAPWPAFRGAASDSCLQGLGESIGAPRTFWISTGWTGRRPRMQERKVRDRQPSFLQWWQGAVASCWDEVCCFHEDSIHPCAEGVLLCAGPSGPGRGVGPAALALELPLPREEDKSKARDEAMLVPSCQSWCSTANNIYYFCDYYYYSSYSYYDNYYYYLSIGLFSEQGRSGPRSIWLVTSHAWLHETQPNPSKSTSAPLKREACRSPVPLAWLLLDHGQSLCMVPFLQPGSWQKRGANLIDRGNSDSSNHENDSETIAGHNDNNCIISCNSISNDSGNDDKDVKS